MGVLNLLLIGCVVFLGYLYFNGFIVLEIGDLIAQIKNEICHI